jgi:hypothetical protein
MFQTRQHDIFGPHLQKQQEHLDDLDIFLSWFNEGFVSAVKNC